MKCTDIYSIPVYSNKNVSPLAKIKRTYPYYTKHLTYLLPSKNHAYPSLPSCSLLLTYDTSLASQPFSLIQACLSKNSFVLKKLPKSKKVGAGHPYPSLYRAC